MTDKICLTREEVKAALRALKLKKKYYGKGYNLFMWDQELIKKLEEFLNE